MTDKRLSKEDLSCLDVNLGVAINYGFEALGATICLRGRVKCVGTSISVCVEVV